MLKGRFRADKGGGGGGLAIDQGGSRDGGAVDDHVRLRQEFAERHAVGAGGDVENVDESVLESAGRGGAICGS